MMRKHSQIQARTLVDLVRASYAAFNADGGHALSAALVHHSMLSVVPLMTMMVMTERTRPDVCRL